MKIDFYFNDDEGTNVFEIPELKGKEIDISDMGCFYDIAGWPDLDEDDNEEDDNKEDDNEEDAYAMAPTYTIETITDDDGLFDHIEIVIESGYYSAKSSAYCEEISDDLIDDFKELLEELIKAELEENS